MAKKKKVSISTPVGRFIYPYLIIPDAFKGEEKFKANLRLTAEDAASIVAKLETMLVNQKMKDTVMNDGESYDYAKEHLPFDVEDNGDITLKATLKKVGNKGKPTEFEQRPDVFDGRGKPMTDPAVKIYSGSTGRISVEAYTWSMDQEGGRGVGVSLRLKAAQVLSLAERAEADADSYGFESDEDGFDASAVEGVTPAGEDF